MADRGEFSAWVADRAALERVYHAHRTGTKPAFEQAMPAAMIEQLIRLDLHKEAVLQKNYGIAITPAMLAAEVARINTTTRAPEILAEIKHALGDDPARFAQTMARPILVERELHRLFENDDALHAQQRRAAEQARAALLAKKPVEGLREVTWQLAPRPENAALPAPSATTPVTGSARSSTYSNEATVQLAQVLTTPAPDRDEAEKFYFEELEPQLQNILRAQLRQPGDVSAVIEMPSGFLLFLLREKAAAVLKVGLLSIPKRSYDEWLAQQPD